MKKPTTLRTLIFALALLFNFVSHAQNGIAFNSNFASSSNGNLFLNSTNPIEKQFTLNASEKVSKNAKVAALTNPVIPYAELPYAGQVTKCPNDGKLLPKLFLCGGNDSRLIDTKITDAQSIIWERFVSGGSCITVSNSDCANETAASTCWNQVGTGPEYLASSAGQFRVRIIDNAGNPYIFYFNVYQNTLIPTATTRSNIIRNAAGSCIVNGKITVGGFGSGYEYSFTTTGTSGSWQDSNIFTTATPGNYTAFIRIKGVVGSCEFKVINLNISNVTFSTTTSIVSPKCNAGQGSIMVTTNDVKLDYTYNLYNSSNVRIATSGWIDNPNYTFTNLNPGTYRTETIVSGPPPPACQVSDIQTPVVIAAAPSALTSSVNITKTLTACDTGTITVTRAGGTTPYKYYVNIDGAGFNEVPTYSITTSKSGTYVIRVVDVNGCAATDKTIVVPVVDKPVYTVTKTDGDCISELGKITINVSDTKNYTLSYNLTPINPANTYVAGTVTGTTTSFVYNNLAAGIYKLKVKYVKGGNTCIDPEQIITIGASNVLTASAGVAELSGCGPAGKEVQGKVRIANAQGGVPFAGANPYLYSFDDRATWITSNEAYVDPRGPSLPYTFYVKDALGCEYKMTGIIMDFRPDPPTISVKDPVFNCDGSATSTVTVTNSGSGNPKFSYDYYMDGVLNPNTAQPNVFLNVTQGDHTITVNYNVLSVSTYSNLLIEDFGIGGFTTTPGINPAYCFEDETTPHPVGYTCGNFNDYQINDGKYAVASKITTTFGGSWLVAKDHTTPTNANGRFLVVNVGGTAGIGGILYSKPIKDVIPNQPVIISLWAENLIKKANSGLHDPKLTIELVNNLNGVGGTETIVATSDPSPGHTNPWQVPKSEKWEYKELQLNPGAYNNLSFVVRSYSNEFNGNDVLLDDFWVRQIPKSCNTVVDFPVYVDGSKAFSAGITGFKNIQCSGEQNGEITLSAKNFDPAKGFQYLIAGDPAGWRTYIPVPAASSGSLTLTNLKAGIYNIQIRYDNSAKSCTFPLAQEIKMPKPLEVKAWVEQVATCDLGATIKAEASEGTPGYEYELRETDGVTVVKPFQSSGEFFDIKKVGNYKIIARDLNSCETAVMASVDVVAAVPPQIGFDTSNLCFNNTAQIIVRVNGGVKDYTYTVQFNGGAVSSPSATFTGPTFTYIADAPGSYTFRVKDSYGCESDPKTQIINEKLTVEVPVTKGLTCDTAPNNRAIITGTISGGKGPFVVTIASGNTTGTLVQPTATGNTFTYTTAVAGDYTFRVTDSGNCTVTSVIAKVAPLNAIVLKSDNKNPKCFGASNGSVELLPAGGAGGFTYSRDNITYNDQAVITGLAAGSYTFYVKDANKCTQSINVTLTNPAAVVASANFQANTTCSSTTIVTITGGGGTGVYSYSFNGSTTYTGTNTLTVNLTSSAQDIIYSVKDSNDCIDTKTIKVPAYNPPTGITFSTPAAITCETGKTTTSVTLTPTAGGIAPFTYLMTSGTGSGASNTTGVFSGLTAGAYSFQITDANGCKTTGGITIDGAPTIAVSGKKTDVKCVGQTSGTATFTVTGASSVGNFTYVLTPTFGTVTQVNDEVKVTGLAAGSYKLQVRDKSTNCLSNEASVTISPATAISITGATASNVNCGNSISNIVVTATGGVPNYKYAYVVRNATMPAASAFSDTNTTINTGATQSNLFWDVYVMDQNDCTAGPFNLDIQREASPSVKSPAPATFCFKAPSTTSINLSTFFNLGTGTHTYTVNGLSVSTPTAYNITASGTYTIIAKDANSCTATATYTINPELTILATRVKDLTCIENAEITFTANGGSNVYSTYEVQFNGAGAWTTVTSPFTTANSGDYQFRVTDNANCQALSNVITITPKTIPSFSHNEKQPTCIGAADGVINITNPTGLAPFTYSITRGATTVSTTATANNLIAGVYTALLTDAKGCTFSTSITLSDPSVLNATVQSTPLACNTDNTTKQATITVTSPSGGTGTGYEYSFNGGAFAATNTYSTSASGTITVVMRDSNKCTQSLTSQTFTALNAPTITGVNGSLITCKTGESTSNVDVTVTNGVGTLAYVIVSGPTINTTGATDGKFTGLANGNYVFKVTDANGCNDVESYTVKPLVSIAATLASQNNVACNAGSTGSASITVSAYTGTYTAVLTSGTGTVNITGSTVDVTNLVQGSYTLRVTDNVTDCFKDVNFTITQPAVVTLTLASNKNANCGQPLSKVSVTAGGGKAPYSYAFRNTTGNPAAGDYVLNANSADLNPATTTWYAWVKDANGCEQSLTITIAKDPDAVINMPAQQCFAAPFVITLSGAGKAPLEYTVNGSTLTGTTYSVTASGTYIVGVKDANGCTDFKNYVVEKQIFANAVPGKDLTCSTPTAASITVNITNGTAPYSYQIYNGTVAVGSPVTGILTNSFTETFTSPGNYSFEVTDSKGCPVKTNALPVTPTGTIVANEILTLANCNGSSDGSVTFNGSGGKAPYKYSLNGSPLDFGNTFGGLAAGTYNYIVEDARGCRDTGTITIGQPNAIVPTFKVNDIKCNSNIPGSIEITSVVDGVAPFIYTLYDKTNTAIHTSAPISARTYVFPNNLAFGDYSVTIVDKNGCEVKSGKLRISTVPYLKFAPPSITGTCLAGATVNLFLDTTFPSAPNYKYSIYGDPSTVSPATAATTYQFTGLKFGQTYFFQVEDNNGCFSIVEVPIAPLSLIQFNTVTTTDVSCKTTPSVPNGSVSFTISNYDSSVGQLQVEVLDQLTNLQLSPRVFRDYNVTSITTVSDLFTGLPAGSYTLRALELDGTQCSNATTFEISQPTQPVSVSVVSQTNDNCNTDARVTVKGTGGTGPYQYTFVADGAAEPTAGYSSTNPLTLNYELDDEWDIWVKDAKGCTAKVDVTILKDAPPATQVGPAVPCFTGAPFTVDLSQYFTSTVGTPIYTLDGLDQATSIATITAARTYVIGVRDGNGCIATAPYIVRDILTLGVTAKKELDCKSPAPNASITVKAEGGIITTPSSYTYTITAGTTINTTGATTGIFTNLDAGNYTFQVSDGTCTATTTVTIDALIPIVPTRIVGTPLCVGDAAKVEINAIGGTGIYTYGKGAAPTLTTQTNNIFSQTAAEGTVTYYVKDSNDCVETIDVTVTNPTPLVITNIDRVQMLCGGGNLPTDATITVTATGGAGGFEYSFDNGAHYSGNNVFTTTNAGTYNVIVKDANGCTTVMQPAVIDALDPPVITGFNKSQMTCPALVSDVTINTTNGIGTLTFDIVSGPVTTNTTGDATGTYTGLPAGDYVFRVTDGNNCTDEELFTVPALPTLQMQPQVVSNVNCMGGSNASATFTGTDFTASGAFSYSVVTTPAALPFTPSKTGNVVTLSNLVKGNYEVTFTDNTTNCTVTKSVDITEPALALSITAVASNVHCNDPVSQITMTPAGGTSPYTYSIVQSGAGAGTYSTGTTIDTTTLTNGVVSANGLGMTWLVDVHILDANNCTAMTTVTITKDDLPTVTTPTLASNQCTANGNYTFTATGTGVAPLSFSINGTDYFVSTGTTYTFTVPAPTTASQAYTVYIKDVNGCTATSTTSTTVYKPLIFSVVQDKDITCVPLPTTTGAQFTLTAADGNPAYTYEVNINNGGFNTITSPYTTNVTGTYVFRVTDSNSCQVTSDEIIINAPVNPAFTTVKADVKCNGGSTGTITVTPSGGVGPYTFALSGGITPNNSGDTTGLYTGLAAGSYTIVVTDHYGCTSGVTPAIVINEPTLLAATASFPANTTCDVATVITVVGNGGTPNTASTPPYQYSFDNGVTYDSSDKLTINNNGSVQTIWYSVKDANGCTTAPQSIIVNPLNKPDKLDFNATLITCKLGENVSTVDVKATNGVGALEFRIVATNTATSPTLFGPITTTGSAVAASFPGLLPGEYTFEVKDFNGCTYQDVYTVKELVNITVEGNLDAGVACKGEANGKVTFKVSNFNTGFTHTITGVNAPGIVTPVGTDTFVLTNLAVGPYTINVTDNVTNCVASITVNVTEPETLGVNYATLKNANCTDGAKIKATAFDGTPGYTYAFVKTGDPVVYDVADTAVLDKAFTWVLWAKDSHDCETSTPVTIITDPMPVITAVTPTHCPTATGYEITVTASGFTSDLEYSIDKNTWQLNNNILVVTSPGDYKVYVRDANLCVVEAPVTILTPLQLKYELTTAPICNGNQGVVTLLPSGGTVTPSYEFSQDGITFGPSAVFSNLTPGSYIFTVRDTGTGCTKTVDVVIETPNTAIDFTLTQSQVICNGGSTGSITVKLAASTATVNNNPVYTYSINPAPTGMVLVGNVFTNLPQGFYTVTVTSGKGCPVDQTITVTEPPIITVPAPVVAEYGCTSGNKENNATITINTPTGGSGNYTVYEFFRNGNPVAVQRGDNPVFIEADLLGGNYVINVYDDKGCVGTATATINPFIAIDFANPALTITRPITCLNNEDIQVNVTFTGGPAVPLQYTIVATASNATPYPSVTNANGQFTNLTVGTYTITVTNPVTGCILKTIHYVDEPNTFDIIAENIKNVTCFGTATGSVDLTFVDNKVDPTDDAGIFDYTITGPVNLNGRSTGTVINIPNLPEGIYHVSATLVATPTCQVETDFLIAQPASQLQIAETHTPITCDPGNDGTITVSATGGWSAAYEYELVGPVNVAYSDQYYFENLTAGVYTVNVRDFNNCVQTATVTLKNPDPILVTANATVGVLTCNGDNSGEITVNLPTGGQESNYSYILNFLTSDPLISTEPQTSPVFSGLPAGRYSVTVIDGINCVSQPSAEIEITEPSKVESLLVLETGVTCKTDATLTLSAQGGAGGPYEYSTDQAFTTVAGSFATSITFSVALGDHQYYVRDSKGCVGNISNNVTINPLMPLDLELDLTNAEVYCKGSATAVIDATATGGLGNYSYTLLSDTGAIVRPAQSEGYFDLLPKGVYVVRVDSGDCQYDSATITIDEPSTELSAIPTVTDATCFGANDGKIAIAASGGTGIIKYAISPNLGQFDDKSVFDRLSPGTYTIIVQDENSCFIIIEREIKEPNVLEGKIVGPILQEICDGDKDGAFTIEVSGGRPPYSISLDNENGTYVPLNNGTRHDFTGLKGGIHNVYVKDASCTTMVEVIMDKAVILNPTAEVTYDCINNAQANMVVVTIDASNTNSADVDYALDNGTFQPSNIFTNVAAGSHFITTRHTNGCTKETVPFTINAVAEVGLVDVTDASKNINVLEVKASGGIAPYEYSFNGEPFSSSNTYRIYKTGDYPVIVRDKNGCEATIIVHGIFYDFCMPNYFTPNGAGSNTTIGPGCGALAYKELTFDIFDRYGRAVAKYHVGQEWDGKYNGNELPTGDYWYVLKLNDPKDNREFVGHFTLYR